MKLNLKPWYCGVLAVSVAGVANAQEPAEVSRVEAKNGVLALRSSGGTIELMADGPESGEMVHPPVAGSMARAKIATKAFGGSPAEVWSMAFAGETEPISSTYLGVVAVPVGLEVRHQLPIAKGTGLVIDLVSEGSPAAEAGLKKHDVLTKLDDQILIHPQQLSVLVGNHQPGDEVKLTYLRQGKEESATVKLGERKEGDAAKAKGGTTFRAEPLRIFERRIQLPEGARVGEDLLFRLVDEADGKVPGKGKEEKDRGGEAGKGAEEALLQKHLEEARRQQERSIREMMRHQEKAMEQMNRQMKEIQDQLQKLRAEEGE